MPKYYYKTRDRVGNPSSGTIDAPSVVAAQALIREQDLILLSLKEANTGSILNRFAFFRDHVKTKDLVVFARQLAVLITATVPIVRALRILSKQTESPGLQRVVTIIADEVDGGARLSSAMHRYPRVFDDFFVYMIRSGETTGRLDEVLQYLADQKEKDYGLVSRIVSSMIYPAFIVLVMGVIFVFMMIYVVPKLLDIVASTGAELPFTTKILLGVSGVFQQYWWVLVILIIGGVIGYRILRSYPQGKRRLDIIKLHVPVFGNIFHKIYLARISRSLANLLASGVPVNKSLEIVSDIVGNKRFQEMLLSVQQKIEGGRSLSAALSGYPEIPPMMIQMMDVGEETGRLDQILTKIADFYTGEVEALSRALVSLIEPMIIIVLGIGALLLVSGILMPIYSITAQF